MCCCANGITHIVESVENAGKVEISAIEILRLGNVKFDIGNPGIGSLGTRLLNCNSSVVGAFSINQLNLRNVNFIVSARA